MRRKATFPSAILLLAGAPWALPGCRSPEERLSATLRSASSAVKAVRPEAALEDARAEIWTPWADLEALTAKEEDHLSLLQARRIWEAQAPVLLRLGVTDHYSIEQVGKELVRLDSDSTEGIALPSEGRILVKRALVDSLPVLAHELAHVASGRMGYLRQKERISLYPGKEPRPGWVDLDSLIALFVLQEGDAQATARVAEHESWGGSRGVRRGFFWNSPVSVDFDQVAYRLRSGSIRYPDGTVISVEAGQKYMIPGPLLEALLYLAYEGSLATVLAYHRRDEALEETLRRMWSSASFTTRELIFPRRIWWAREPWAQESLPGRTTRETETPERSSLAARARRQAASLEKAGASGATRIGAFLVQELLVRTAHLDNSRAREVVVGFEDDLVLRAGDSGLLWLSEWRDEAAARRFADLYQAALSRRRLEVRVKTEGRMVLSTVGEPPEAQALLELLRRG